MRLITLLAVASLCLTILPLVPSVTAAPPAINSCKTISTATTVPPGCQFVCFVGDLISVSAVTTGPGEQYPRLAASCGGASVVCQGYRSCSATSSSRATSNAFGTCYAETVYVDGTCTASGGPADDPSTVVNQIESTIDYALDQVGPYTGQVQPYINYVLGAPAWAPGYVLSAPDWAPPYAQSYAGMLGQVAGETAANGGNAPTSCTTAVQNDCSFVCLPGDYIHIRVVGWLTPTYNVYGSASCGGASTSCSPNWWDDYCQGTSGGPAGTAAVGICSGPGHVRATCTATRDPAGIVVGTILGLAGTGIGIALGVVNTGLDSDGDGYVVTAEVLANSDPTSSSSRPGTDDDGDGISNSNERSRAHAYSTLVGNAMVRSNAWDGATFHFGHAGASATIRSPEGATMTIVYVPSASVSAGCPPPVTLSVPELAACSVPVVASFSLDGSFQSARRAYEPGITVPSSNFVVLCAPRTGPAGPCLSNVGADGTWQITPATQSPRASTQPKTPAGFALTIQGKTFNDVAPDSGDINSGGNGQNTRDGSMVVRSWNWHAQSSGTYYACSGGLVAPCPTESGNQENAIAVRQYI